MRSCRCMNFLQQPEHGVVVEYEFFQVPDVDDLPSRVASAVEELIRRERTPSDEDVRAMVQSMGDETESAHSRVQIAPAQTSPASSPTAAATNQMNQRNQSESGNSAARVRVVMPHTNAMELALHRSFQNGGNPVRESRLTTQEIQLLVRQSTGYRLRRLRRRNFPPTGVVTRSRARRARLAHVRPRSPERFECVICMDPIRYRSRRIFLSCGHVYHRECIVQALASLPRRCPSCRTEVVLETEEHEAETDVTF